MLSIIIPLFNEAENIPPLAERLLKVLTDLGQPFEIIFIDDGSTDGSADQLRRLAQDVRIKVVTLRRNYGQTAALMAGIDSSKGNVLIPMDGDQQNDPADIPLLLRKLEEGYDVVSGWRRYRSVPPWRILPSRVANALISWLSGVKLHDFGCTLKAYRREVLQSVQLYGEMHWFIPVYAHRQGGRITELPVRHHARTRGNSKYGFGRVFKVLLDLTVVLFLFRYFTKPIYLFGGFGLLAILFSFCVTGYAIFQKVFRGVYLIQTPLLLLAVMTFITGAMSLLMGFLAEMLVRTYFESQEKAIYSVRTTINV